MIASFSTALFALVPLSTLPMIALQFTLLRPRPRLDHLRRAAWTSGAISTLSAVTAVMAGLHERVAPSLAFAAIGLGADAFLRFGPALPGCPCKHGM